MNRLGNIGVIIADEMFGKQIVFQWRVDKLGLFKMIFPALQNDGKFAAPPGFAVHVYLSAVQKHNLARDGQLRDRALPG